MPPGKVAVMRWKCDSLSSAEQGCDDAGIAATMQHSDDDQRVFVGRVGNQKAAHGMESQRPRRKIGPYMTHLWEWDERPNSLTDFLKDSVGGVQIVNGNEFPDFI